LSVLHTHPLLISSSQKILEVNSKDFAAGSHLSYCALCLRINSTQVWQSQIDLPKTLLHIEDILVCWSNYKPRNLFLQSPSNRAPPINHTHV
jgi:hypothetical protein